MKASPTQDIDGQRKEPMICSLPAAELRERRSEIQNLLEQAISVTAVVDGVELEFAASTEIAHALTDFILFERTCCSNFAYELRSQPDHSKLTLRLTGPVDQVESLRAIFLSTPE